jgi:hypothetical protein
LKHCLRFLDAKIRSPIAAVLIGIRILVAMTKCAVFLDTGDIA